MGIAETGKCHAGVLVANTRDGFNARIVTLAKSFEPLLIRFFATGRVPMHRTGFLQTISGCFSILGSLASTDRACLEEESWLNGRSPMSG